MKRKLLESKISTLSTFEKKSVLLGKTIVNRRIHEIYDLIGIYEPEVNNISSEMYNLKIVIKERNQSSNENILQYRDLKSVLKIKKKQLCQLKKELVELKMEYNMNDDSDASSVDSILDGLCET